MSTYDDVLFLSESLVVRDDLTSTVGNFAGDEKMGDNWLEKIAAAKAAKSAEEEPSEIADEEWVRLNPSVIREDKLVTVLRKNLQR